MSQKALLLWFAALASTFTLQAAETDSDKLYAALHAGNLSELKALLDRGISANAAGLWTGFFGVADLSSEKGAASQGLNENYVIQFQC